MKWRERLQDSTKAMNSLEVSVIQLEFEFLFVLKLAKFFPHLFHPELRKVVRVEGAGVRVRSTPITPISLEIGTFLEVNHPYHQRNLQCIYNFVDMVKIKTDKGFHSYRVKLSQSL